MCRSVNCKILRKLFEKTGWLFLRYPEILQGVSRLFSATVSSSSQNVCYTSQCSVSSSLTRLTGFIQASKDTTWAGSGPLNLPVLCPSHLCLEEMQDFLLAVFSNKPHRQPTLRLSGVCSRPSLSEREGGRWRKRRRKCDEPIFKCETQENTSLTNSQHVCTISWKNMTVLRHAVTPGVLDWWDEAWSSDWNPSNPRLYQSDEPIQKTNVSTGPCPAMTMKSH